MTDFIVSITDPAALAGITWAREQYNASLPPPYVPPETVMGAQAMPGGPPAAPVPAARAEGLEPQAQATLDTDEAYVQWVMETAAASYATQQEQAAWRQAYLDSQNPPAGGARGAEGISVAAGRAVATAPAEGAKRA